MTIELPSPLVLQISPPLPLEATIRAAANLRGLVLFDSPSRSLGLGRWTMLSADPLCTWTVPRVEFGHDPLAGPQSALAAVSIPKASRSGDHGPVASSAGNHGEKHNGGDHDDDQLPWQAGVAGVLGYGAGAAWERIPAPRNNEFQIPDVCCGLYDWVLGWDHATSRCLLLVQPGLAAAMTALDSLTAASALTAADATPAERDWIASAVNRRDRILRQLRARIESPVPDTHPAREMQPARGMQRVTTGNIPTPELAAQYPLSAELLRQYPRVSSTFSRDQYLRAVARAIEYIRAGDIFQVNLAQRLITPATDSAVELYLRLRQRNPAPFAGYYSGETTSETTSDATDHTTGSSAQASNTTARSSAPWTVVSASPERFIRLRDGQVETRPIKGTRRRGHGAEADLFTAAALRQSQKDIAENVMIVDLLRNDLSRVCSPGSLSVPQLCGLETYETVQHLVSVIRGELKPGKTAWDLLRATFPGGSITGAPKVRAMEIIAELEPVARGPYCGSLFYVGCNGNMDSSILIRTFTQAAGWVQFPVGGGVVAQSDPADEYQETLHKAAGMLRALTSNTKQP